MKAIRVPEPTEDGDCWLRDPALGDGFIKLLLRANTLGVDIKKTNLIHFIKYIDICAQAGDGF